MAQDEENWYVSGEGEMIFSFANIDAIPEVGASNVMRWSPVFNFAGHMNKDLSDNIGFNIGLAVRNVGFITDINKTEDNIDKLKFRTYNLGLPVGFKIGKVTQDKPFFLFVGYELELPFQYKSKEFNGSEKTNVTTAWFSDRVNTLQQSVWGGVQFPQGFALKFKYYLTEFFDDSYEENVEGFGNVRPYENFNATIFYFSLEWFPFQNAARTYGSGE